MGLENRALLAALKDFLDFMQRQKGAYADACAGYRANHQETKRQVSRVMRPTGRKLDSKGVPSIVHTTVEDPSNPDVIVRATRLSSEFLSANARSGSNEQQLCQAIVVFIFTYWDDEIRYRVAKALNQEKGDILIPIFGDLRLLRIAILHDKAVLRAVSQRRLEVLGEYFRADQPVTFSHEKMHHIFRMVDKAIARFTFEATGAPVPPGGLDEVDMIAIPDQKASGDMG